MATVPNQNLSAVDRPLALRARRDIEQTPVAYAGRTAYVLKDPLTLELFQLTAEEQFLFQSLRVPTTLSRLRRGFEERFAPQRIAYEALQHGLNQLYSQGLLLSEAPAQGRELVERADRRRRSERLQNLLRLLSIRLGSVDATRVVDGLHARLRWLFSPPMLAVATAVVLYAGWILLGHGREVIARLPSVAELAQPRTWLLWLATIALVKVVHELAHAVVCRHLGGRCHEMGLLLLGFVPCLYCDVSDVWRLPSKWRRIAVSAAGMAVEGLIAAAALILWWHTQPGLWHTWALSLVIVCSVGTLLVNANPLLRYDGYYILSDLVEIPNLAGRAQGLLPAALRRWLLGESRTDDPLLSRRQRRALVLYAMASRMYLALVLLGVFVALLALARPYHLENAVYTLGLFTVAGMLWQPAVGVWRGWRNPVLRSRLRGRRALLLATVVVGAMAAVLFWPIARTITGPAVFAPAGGRAVYAPVGGELICAVAPGAQVRQGQVLARLAADEIALALAEQQGEYEVRRVRYTQLQAMRTWDDRVLEQLPTAQAALADAQKLLDERRREAEQLVLHAPATGTVVAPPETPSRAEQDRLPSWFGSPLEARNVGCRIEPGTILCTVADPHRLEALVAIDQADVSVVQPGQAVRLLVDSAPARVLHGEVVEVARRGVLREGGADAGKYHLAVVRLDAQDPLLLAGARGRAKIKTNSSTLGGILADKLRRVLRWPW